MTTTRQLVAVGVGILVLVGTLGVGSATLGDGGPAHPVAPLSTGPPDHAGPNASDANETVETVNGTLEATGGEDYRLGNLTIDVGAAWYVNDTAAPADLDGDGTVETIRGEFDGLVGQEVTLTVESDGEEGDVLVVGDQQYREEGPPPWAGGPHGSPGHEPGDEGPGDGADDDQ